MVKGDRQCSVRLYYISLHILWACVFVNGLLSRFEIIT